MLLNDIERCFDWLVFNTNSNSISALSFVAWTNFIY